MTAEAMQTSMMRSTQSSLHGPNMNTLAIHTRARSKCLKDSLYAAHGHKSVCTPAWMFPEKPDEWFQCASRAGGEWILVACGPSPRQQHVVGPRFHPCSHTQLCMLLPHERWTQIGYPCSPSTLPASSSRCTQTWASVRLLLSLVTAYQPPACIFCHQSPKSPEHEVQGM